ncbi:hypothetical protein HPULCUR_003410 [Helicostylum pulchrum]|uniref:Uncharacterized protein n=1 Tax=Helicostylum pulchrum TaxID=562976 RepID=A0ABP9XTD0_9FUNG
MRNFIGNNATKLPINLWKDYVNEHFDSIARELEPPTSTVTDKEADIELDLSDVTKPDNESSRSRIKCLKSMTKHLLFSIEEPTAVEDIQKEIPDATEKEVTTVNLLIQTLKPYIPDKKNRFVIGYQLPFCLLANDILHITGYTKFTRSLFPTPRPSLLYQMLTSEPNAFSIADFVGGAAEKEPTSYISRILNNPVVIEESKKDLSDLKQAVDTLQNKINNL